MNKSASFWLLCVLMGCKASDSQSSDSGVPAQDANVVDANAGDANTGDANIGDASAADAGVSDASHAAVSMMVDEEGGSLTTEGLTLTVPAGAVAVDTLVQVTVLDEVPSISGVTPLTPVFEFGPDGASFATELLVSFALDELAPGTVPTVYWTNEDGEFEAQGAWWADGTVHTIATHFSKAFVGTSAEVPAGLLCRTPADLTAERGVCLLNAALATGPVMDGAGPVDLVSDLVVVRNATNVPGTLTVRQTPVRPAASGIRSTGSVADVAGEIGEDGHVQICLNANLSEDDARDSCLGYFDESKSEWKCEDACLVSGGGKVCGTTDHFTSFAILLDAHSVDEDNGTCRR